MEHRIAPLIAERAPWLYHDAPHARIAKAALHRLLGYRQTLAIAQRFEQAPAASIMSQIGKRLSQSVSVSGLANIPTHGPALIVANHPTGIADGVILHHLIAKRRGDAYFFANSDILRVFPQMDGMIAPVEWRQDQRTHTKTRKTMSYIRQATDDGRLGVIFPSGRLAKRRGLRLHERPWMGSAAMLTRKFGLPVIPVNIQARNSTLFYLLDLIHPSLRDITLFHETLNKDRQPFVVTVGDAISASAIPKNAEAGIALLRKTTLALGGKDAPTVNLIATSRGWAR